MAQADPLADRPASQTFLVVDHHGEACRARSGCRYHPNMPVDIDIAKVARLARLGLSPDELDSYGAQLQDILEHAARVQALPTEGVTPTAHPLPMVNAHRPDEVGESLDRDEFLSQAPDAQDGYFRVPPFLEEG